jgi:hypothetical protein
MQVQPKSASTPLAPQAPAAPVKPAAEEAAKKVVEAVQHLFHHDANQSESASGRLHAKHAEDDHRMPWEKLKDKAEDLIGDVVDHVHHAVDHAGPGLGDQLDAVAEAAENGGGGVNISTPITTTTGSGEPRPTRR